MFIDFLTGREGQALIAGYRVGGEPVFFVYEGK
jgi:ABC-type tungstate transport system permease subunit